MTLFNAAPVKFVGILIIQNMTEIFFESYTLSKIPNATGGIFDVSQK